MGSKATDKRRRRLHEALLIAASLAMVLAAAPVLAQEEEVVAPTRAIAEPEATPPPLQPTQRRALATRTVGSGASSSL